MQTSNLMRALCTCTAQTSHLHSKARTCRCTCGCTRLQLYMHGTSLREAYDTDDTIVGPNCEVVYIGVGLVQLVLPFSLDTSLRKLMTARGIRQKIRVNNNNKRGGGTCPV